MIFIWLILIGLGAGLLGALLGIGGGIIIVPSLVLLLKIPMKNAVALSLATIVSISLILSIYNFFRRLVNIKLALILEILTASCAIGAGQLAVHVNSHILEIIFGLFLFGVSISMLRPLHFKTRNAGGKMSYSYFDPKLKKRVYYNVRNLKTAILTSSLAGIASGLLGIGGGVLKVPILNEICRVPMRVATATSNFMVGLTALSAGLVYFYHGYLHFNFMPGMISGVIIGALLGLYIKRHLDNNALRKIFALIMSAVGIIMILKP